MKTRTHALRFTVWNKINPKILFFILTFILLSIFGFYAYLVHQTIMNVVAREKTAQAIAALSSSNGELEYKYMSIRNGVTLDLAHAKGFEDATPSQFIGRSGSHLSFNSR